MFKNLWEIENKANHLKNLVVNQASNAPPQTEYHQILESSMQALSPLHLNLLPLQRNAVSSPLLLKPSPEPKQVHSDFSAKSGGTPSPGAKALPAVTLPPAQESPKTVNPTGTLVKSTSLAPAKPKRPATTAYHGSPISAMLNEQTRASATASPTMTLDDNFIKRTPVEPKPPLAIQEAKIEKTTVIEPDSTIISESLQNNSLLRGSLSIEINGELRKLWFSNKKKMWKLRYFPNDKVKM